MTARVQLWGRTIGAVSLEEGRDVAAFQYDAEFARSGIELSPLMMPLSDRVYEADVGWNRRLPEWGPSIFPYVGGASLGPCGGRVVRRRADSVPVGKRRRRRGREHAALEGPQNPSPELVLGRGVGQVSVNVPGLAGMAHLVFQVTGRGQRRGDGRLAFGPPRVPGFLEGGGNRPSHELGRMAFVEFVASRVEFAKDAGEAQPFVRRQAVGNQVRIAADDPEASPVGGFSEQAFEGFLPLPAQEHPLAAQGLAFGGTHGGGAGKPPRRQLRQLMLDLEGPLPVLPGDPPGDQVPLDGRGASRGLEPGEKGGRIVRLDGGPRGRNLGRAGRRWLNTDARRRDGHAGGPDGGGRIRGRDGFGYGGAVPEQESEDDIRQDADQQHGIPKVQSVPEREGSLGLPFAVHVLGSHGARKPVGDWRRSNSAALDGPRTPDTHWAIRAACSVGEPREGPAWRGGAASQARSRATNSSGVGSKPPNRNRSPIALTP
ncbi:MAG: HipA N-terminal domain-containing protein [Verrucomicrobiae bacterium]|nr:HipA N-terminal domain-containing protein [Verrucomicrobiae bacterium]